MKRFVVLLPNEIAHQVESLAEQDRLSSQEILRRAVMFGLVATHALRESNTKIIIRRGGYDQEIIFNR